MDLTQDSLPLQQQGDKEHKLQTVVDGPKHSDEQQQPPEEPDTKGTEARDTPIMQDGADGDYWSDKDQRFVDPDYTLSNSGEEDDEEYYLRISEEEEEETSSYSHLFQTRQKHTRRRVVELPENHTWISDDTERYRAEYTGMEDSTSARKNANLDGNKRKTVMPETTEPTEVTALTNNYSRLVEEAVLGGIQRFADHLVEKRFISRQESRMDTLGISPYEQASSLMSSVLIKLTFSERRRHWFHEFLSIFSDPVHNELVEKLRREGLGSIEEEIYQQHRLTTENDHLTSENKRFNAEKGNLLSENKSLYAEKEHLALELKCLISENKQLTSVKTQLVCEKQRLTSQNEQLSLDKEHLASENKQIAADKEILESERKHIATEKDKLALESKQLATEEEKLASENKRLATEKVELETQKKNLVSEKEHLVSENKRLTLENQDLLAKNRDFASQNKHLTSIQDGDYRGNDPMFEDHSSMEHTQDSPLPQQQGEEENNYQTVVEGPKHSDEQQPPPEPDTKSVSIPEGNGGDKDKAQGSGDPACTPSISDEEDDEAQGSGDPACTLSISDEEDDEAQGSGDPACTLSISDEEDDEAQGSGDPACTLSNSDEEDDEEYYLRISDEEETSSYSQLFLPRQRRTRIRVVELPKPHTWNSDDTKRYRAGYPGMEDSTSAKKNLKFFRNEIPYQPRGTTIEKFHDQMWGEMRERNQQRIYDELEKNHSYIQWLFPIREKGMNRYSQELQQHEIKEMLADEDVRKRLMTSYKIMLDFYGLELVNRETGKLRRTKNFTERFENLNQSSHNYLRITCILKCLGEFEMERYKAPFIKFMLREAIITRRLRNVLNSCMCYWLEVVRDEKERENLRKLAEKMVRKVNGSPEVIQKDKKLQASDKNRNSEEEQATNRASPNKDTPETETGASNSKSKEEGSTNGKRTKLYRPRD